MSCLPRVTTSANDLRQGVTTSANDLRQGALSQGAESDKISVACYSDFVDFWWTDCWKCRFTRYKNLLPQIGRMSTSEYYWLDE